MEVGPPDRELEILNAANASASMISPPLQRNTVLGGSITTAEVQPGIC
jgi:hypothetical protein